MALADILERIERDARDEADVVLQDADTVAEEILAHARLEAEASSRRIRDTAERRAIADAETLVAGARLRSRDEDVRTRRELVDRVLREAADSLIADESTYVGFLAREILASARGGERVLIAEADRQRLRGLPAEVDRLAREAGRDLALAYAEEPADIPHGVVLVAQRVRIEVSPAAALAGRRDEVTVLAAERLFGGGR